MGFQNIISTFPTDHASTYATEFVTELNQEDHSDLTDLDAMMHRMDEMLDVVFPPIADSESESEQSESEYEPGVSSISSPMGSANLGQGSRSNSVFGRVNFGNVVERFSIRGSRIS